MRLTRALAGWGCMLLACAAHAQAYKCQGADGRTVYQQVPCETGSRSQTIDTPGPQAAPSIPKAPSRTTPPAIPNNLSRADREKLQLLHIVELCRRNLPAFEVKSGPAYRTWLMRNPSLANLAPSLPDVGSVPEAQKAYLTQVCNDNIIAALDETSRPVNPEYAEPTKTWAVFIGALQRADRAAAIACTTGQAEQTLRQALPQMSDDDVRKMGSGFTGIGQSWGTDEVAEYFVARGGRASSIHFTNVFGAWKISAL